MKSDTKSLKTPYFLLGGGEMGELIRERDWSITSLGPPESWPQTLQTMVGVMLDNPFGMYIAWGKEYIQLYNDGYRPILGATKHPNALGISTRNTFAEIWHIIGSMFDGVMNGKAVGFPDFRLELDRNGFAEECYFDFSYSPIRMDDGTVCGVLVTVIETTNKKKAEEALKASEERFRTMADNIPQLAWMADRNGSIYWYNKRWFNYTGTNLVEMQGWQWRKVHHPKYVKNVEDKFKKAIKMAEPWEDTFPLRRSDGTFRWFLSRAFPIRNEEGAVLQWFGTNTDITEQIEVKQALTESEQRFRTMAEATDLLIAVGDETGNSIYFNKAWTDFTGKPLEEILKLNWVDLIHPDDRDNYLSIYLNAFEKRKAFIGEFRVRNKEGKYRWLLVQAPPRFSADGTFAGYINSGIDITDRKNAENLLQQNEQNLRNTIIQAPVAMAILKGKDYVVELANERMYELWGKSAEILMNRPIFEALPEAKDQGFEVLLEGVFKTGETYSASGMPIYLPRNDKNELVYLNYVYEPYREADGKVTGILVVAIDVTDQVKACHKIEEVVAERTKELELANNKLQKTNAELAQFAYIASHDLQEPLRKITTFSHMLEDSLGDNLDEQSKKFLQKINTSSSKMSMLIRDVLNYAQLGKENVQFEKVDLNQIIESVKADYELLIEQKQASIITNHLPVLKAIPLQMAQLFGNLIGNALKFSRKDQPPVIKIIAENTKSQEIDNLKLYKKPAYYKIQIKDNGIGFKNENAEQIFSIFQRLHRKSEYEGTGIGLALCKKIVLNHQGNVNANGSSENGAVFNIYLPVKQ